MVEAGTYSYSLVQNNFSGLGSGLLTFLVIRFLVLGLARELLHLRFSGCRKWGLDKRKGMSSFSGMVSEMASLPSDGASDLPLEMQYMGFHGSISWFRFLARGESSLSGGTCDTCTDAWLERFDNEFNLVLDAHPTG
ncbi:unnamed protein product [Brassica oleracea]